MESAAKWFYNITTGEIEQGKVTGFENRMGPYDTPEQAREALAIARERTRAADAYDDADDWADTKDN